MGLLTVLFEETVSVFPDPLWMASSEVIYIFVASSAREHRRISRTASGSDTRGNEALGTAQVRLLPGRQ